MIMLDPCTFQVYTKHDKCCLKTPMVGFRCTQRVHVAISYIPRAQTGSHIITSGTKMMYYSCVDPLG